MIYPQVVGVVSDRGVVHWSVMIWLKIFLIHKFQFHHYCVKHLVVLLCSRRSRTYEKYLRLVTWDQPQPLFVDYQAHHHSFRQKYDWCKTQTRRLDWKSGRDFWFSIGYCSTLIKGYQENSEKQWCQLSLTSKYASLKNKDICHLFWYMVRSAEDNWYK